MRHFSWHIGLHINKTVGHNNKGNSIVGCYYGLQSEEPPQSCLSINVSLFILIVSCLPVHPNKRLFVWTKSCWYSLCSLLLEMTKSQCLLLRAHARTHTYMHAHTLKHTLMFVRVLNSTLAELPVFCSMLVPHVADTKIDKAALCLQTLSLLPLFVTRGFASCIDLRIATWRVVFFKGGLSCLILLLLLLTASVV
jgi:hypothetical protein